jgi:hypothetical protein
MKLEHLTWPTEGWGYMPNTDEARAGFEYIKNWIKPDRILEIGFHVGHSTSYMLELMPNVKVDTIGVSGDDELFVMKKKARHAMIRKYGDRFQCKLRNSAWVRQLFKEEYDVAFIDGNHSKDMAAMDIHNCIKMKIPILLIDNCEKIPVQQAIEEFDLDLIETFVYTSQWNGRLDHIEQRLYYVRTNNI